MTRYPVYIQVLKSRKNKSSNEFLLEIYVPTSQPLQTVEGGWCTHKQILAFTKELSNQKKLAIIYQFPPIKEGSDQTKKLNFWFSDHPISSNINEILAIIQSIKFPKTTIIKNMLQGRTENKSPKAKKTSVPPTRNQSICTSTLSKTTKKEKKGTRSFSTPGEDVSDTNSSESHSIGLSHTITSPRSLESSRDSLSSISEPIMQTEPQPFEKEKILLEQANFAFSQLDSLPEITDTILKKVLKYTGGSDLFFIRATDEKMFLDGVVSADATWSLLQHITLSQIQLFSMDILNHAKTTCESINLVNSQQVGASGSDYYVCNIPEAIICVPLLIRKKFMGAVYISQNSIPGAFDTVDTHLVSLVITNLLAIISQTGDAPELIKVKRKGNFVTANQIPNSIMQDTILVYNAETKKWDPQFVTVSEEELLIFSTPFDINPEETISCKEMETILAPSIKNDKNKKISIYPKFPRKFKAKKSLLYIETTEGSNIIWFAFNSLKVSRVWYDVLKKNYDMMNSASRISTNDIPVKIRINPDEIEVNEIIGRGGAASVYSGTYNQHQVAIKVLFDTIDQSEIKDFFSEMKILHSLRNPNVISLMGGYINEHGRPSIVFEYAARGSLNSVLYDPLVDISHEMKIKFMKQTCMALHYLHSFDPPIIHRDLKPGNILVMENWSIKLADFGLARKCNSTLTLAQGTVKWMAPEILSNLPYSIKADIYSFGLVMWEIIEQKPFFEDFRSNCQIEIQVVNHNARPPFSDSFPSALKKIITKCWAPDPDERPTTLEILSFLKSLN